MRASDLPQVRTRPGAGTRRSRDEAGQSRPVTRQSGSAADFSLPHSGLGSSVIDSPW
jgi:hypothetical protein